jgi:hypothetical protein
MKSRQRKALAGLVRAVCALSLILVAFAHRPALAYDAAAAAAAVVFPDGSVAANCLTGQDGDGNGSAGSGACEFCRIAGAIASPAPPDVFESCAVPVRAFFPLPDDDEVIREAFSANAPPRGPPLLQS